MSGIAPPVSTPSTPGAVNPTQAAVGVPHPEALSPHVAQLVTAFALATLSSPGKRKHTSVDDSNPLMNFADFGKKYCRLIEPGFIPVFDIVEHGLTAAAQPEPELAIAPRTVEETLLDGCWGKLTSNLPGFEEAMIDATPDRTLRRRVCGQIHSTVQEQRSNDTGGLKYKILNYLNFDTALPLDPPIASDDHLKSHRGWNNASTAHLLTPLEYESNADTWNDIKSGRKTATEDQWARFLYPNGRQYNPNDEEEGLFKGHVVLRVAKHIYLGPSCALKGAGFKRGKSNNAKRIGLTKMTPEALAYVVIQARFAISDTEHWDRTDTRGFDLHKLWCNVVAFFEDGEGTAVLEYFTRELFGLSAATATTEAEAPVSALERMRAERANKRIRARL